VRAKNLIDELFHLDFTDQAQILDWIYNFQEPSEYLKDTAQLQLI
jgi:hypothetical protein